MKHNAPGKAHRAGMTMMEPFEMFPDETAAREWFESVFWSNERHCGHCGSTKTHEVPNAKPMPYRCTSCRSYFSVRTNTPLAHSKMPLRK